MDKDLPRSATLTPDVLQSAIAGLMTLREVERDEVHRLIFGSKTPQPCFGLNCLSRGSLGPPYQFKSGPAAPEAYKRVLDHIVGSSQPFTKALQVPKFNWNEGGNTVRVFPEFCRVCLGRWEVGHADLRRKVWAMLPSIFGLEG